MMCLCVDQSGVSHVAHVLLQVYLQAAGGAEGLGALDAAVRLLSWVCALVFLHGVSVAEGAAAVRAAVRTLARVDAEVSPQVSSLAEALGAEGAAVRPLARVRAQVTPQVRRLCEGFAAPLAGVGFSLLLQVEAETAGLAERLAAARTAVDQFWEVPRCSDIINLRIFLRRLPVSVYLTSLCVHHHRPAAVWSVPERFLCDWRVHQRVCVAFRFTHIVFLRFSFDLRGRDRGRGRGRGPGLLSDCRNYNMDFRGWGRRRTQGGLRGKRWSFHHHLRLKVKLQRRLPGLSGLLVPRQEPRLRVTVDRQ